MMVRGCDKVVHLAHNPQPQPLKFTIKIQAAQIHGGLFINLRIVSKTIKSAIFCHDLTQTLLIKTKIVHTKKLLSSNKHNPIDFIV